MIIIKNKITFNGNKKIYYIENLINIPKAFNHDSDFEIGKGIVYYAYTTSEIEALNFYRKNKFTTNDLKYKWNKEINKQDYLYKLSKSVESSIDLPNTISPDFTPRPHQMVAIEFGEITDGNFIIADQQRTGKTYSSLLYVLSQKWTSCLIVCPSKVCSVWEKMIFEISSRYAKILKSNDSIEKGFNICSYDILHTINDINVDITIADEAHFFVNGTSRRNHAIHNIVSKKKICLTGTPILNSAIEILEILNWLNPELSKEMRLFIQPYLDLHSDNYTVANLLGKELKRRCLLLRETNQVGDTNEPNINFIEIDTYIDNPKNLQEVGKAMIDYAIEYLKCFQNKIVVMFYHQDVGKMLSARLGSKSIIINGTNSKKEVSNAIEEFRNNDNIQFLCGSEVLAEGIDLSFCDHMLILQSSYSMRTDQVRERCNNIYKERNVTIDVLTIPSTQSERQYKILEGKYNLQHGLRDA